MKELKRFLRKYRKEILSYTIAFLFVAIIAMTFVLLFSESMNGAYVFFLVAMLMVALILNYSQKKGKSKGIIVFYIVSAVASIAIGLLLMLLPTPVA